MSVRKMPSPSPSLAALGAVAIPSRPHELTSEFLSFVLLRSNNQQQNKQQIQSFSWSPLNVGVISEVVGISIELVVKDTQHWSHQEESLPQRRRPEQALGALTRTWEIVAKFQRPEFPVDQMFQVESTFYQRFGSKCASALGAEFPFELPHALFTSKTLILLDRIPNVERISCVQGCPQKQLYPVVERLARMHAQFWQENLSELSPNAGIGSDLDSNTKRKEFPTCWKSFVDQSVLSSHEKERLAAICQQLSARPEQLEWIHDVVESGPKTMIHGDFHVANMLFGKAVQHINANNAHCVCSERMCQCPEPQYAEKEDTDGENDDCDDQEEEQAKYQLHNDKDAIWLLDWATCGTGNPMRDVVFFLIVGVNGATRRASEANVLELYYATLVEAASRRCVSTGPCSVNGFKSDHRLDAWTLEDWLEMYRVCLVNQFVILVVYNHLTNQLVANASSPRMQQELDQHFKQVNVRCCRALLDHFDDVQLLAKRSAQQL